MNIEKPYLPVLIIGSQAPAPESYIEQKNFSIALGVDPATGTLNKRITGRLIAGHTPFLLLFNYSEGEVIISAEMEDLIKLCLFSKNYIREGDSPVIAFIHSGERHPDISNNRYPGHFISQLQRQGWLAITLWELDGSLSFGDQIRKKKRPPLFVEQIDFDENFLLHYFFSEPDYMGKYILFNHTITHSAVLIEEAFARLCESAIGQHILLRLYLTNYLVVKKTGAATENKNRILSERLNNAENTIDIIRTKYKDDYDILFNWYQKEYEVLPLWYKRLGHILKVITGKRTIKSLFNEDKKKHALID